jgi:TPR repeat protein
VRKPSSAVEKAAPGAKRILSGMVADTLALSSARIKAEAEFWYENGVSCYVAQNHPEAVKWYRKAADQGIAGAQFSLGVCYDFGDGVTQDHAEAVKWYRKAADQGIAGAQNNLGNCYRDGQGVAQDQAEAIKWYRKAADHGESRAQNNLGVCYEAGQGVPQDDNEAVKWFRKAADQGLAEAQYSLSRSYEKIVGEFCDFLATHTPLIGDCSLLPYPKKTIHYAIAWVLNDYENKREDTTNQALREKLDKIIPTFRYALTRLVDDWQEIEHEDKEAIEKLCHFDSFPDWALPLKLKYLDDERAAEEACEMAIQVIQDKVEREKSKR